MVKDFVAKNSTAKTFICTTASPAKGNQRELVCHEVKNDESATTTENYSRKVVAKSRSTSSQSCRDDTSTPFSIHQSSFDPITGQYVIPISGEYTVEEDVIGTIVIPAPISNVSIDLETHQITSPSPTKNAITVGNPSPKVEVSNNGRTVTFQADLKDPLVKHAIAQLKKEGEHYEPATFPERRDLVLTRNRVSAALVSQQQHHVSISNGSIVGTISINNVFDASLSNLTLLSVGVAGAECLVVTDSTSVRLEDVNFLGSDTADESAAIFSNTDEITIENGDITGFSSVNTPIVLFKTCNAVTVKYLNVLNNTRAPTVSMGSTDYRMALISSLSCNQLNFQHVNVSENTVSYSVIGQRRFSCIGFFSCDTISMDYCVTSENTDITGDEGNNTSTAATFQAADRFLYFLLSSNIIVRDHQANKNVCTKIISGFNLILARDSFNVILERAQANQNSIDGQVSETRFFSQFRAIFSQFAGGVPLYTDTFVTRSCQANENAVKGGPASRYKEGNILTGFQSQISFLCDDCEAVQNTYGAPSGGVASPSGAYGFTGSFFSAGGTLTRFRARLNTGGFTSAGAVFNGSFQQGPYYVIGAAAGANLHIEACDLSYNGNYGLIFAFLGFPETSGGNLVIADTILSGNGGNIVDETAGIRIVNLQGSYKNITIRDTVVENTFSQNGLEANGIKIENAQNVSIENTNVFQTEASLLSLPAIYSNGTASQTGTIITGVNTNFTPDMIASAADPVIGAGGSIVFRVTGETATIVSVDSPTQLSVTPAQTVASQEFDIFYNTPLISQSGSTVTGYGTTFTPAMVGGTITFRNTGDTATVTGFIDATHLTVNVSKTEAVQTFQLVAVGIRGSGILLDNTANSSVTGCKSQGNQTNGFETRNANSKVTLLENVAVGNGLNGYELSDTTTKALVQDNKADENGDFGFVHHPTTLTSTFLGNVSQDNESGGYDVSGAIPVQTLSRSTATFTNVKGNAGLGARFVNIDVISKDRRRCQ